METTVSANNSGGQSQFDNAALKKAVMILRSVNNNLRQQILKLLDENKRMNVTDIYVTLHLEQSVTSQHLAILRNANIVSTERMGKEIYYSLNHARIEQVAEFVKKLTSE